MKTYLPGSNSSIRVPVRALTLTNGETIRLYDTSGPYTDPDFASDLKQGLPPLRRQPLSPPVPEPRAPERPGRPAPESGSARRCR